MIHSSDKIIWLIDYTGKLDKVPNFNKNISG